jgi:FMN-dependent NADH-azoreductase
MHTQPSDVQVLASAIRRDRLQGAVAGVGMNILHIDCSPRPDSFSRQLSADIVNRLIEVAPGATISRRDLAAVPLPHIGPDYAYSLSSPATLAAPLEGSLDLSEALIEEVEAADAIVIGTPMYNLTIPSALKAWIDQVLRSGRTFKSSRAEKVGMLADRPVFVAIASGGTFTGERAGQPDFLTPYLSATLGSIGLKTLQFLALQATAFLDQDTAISARERALAAIDLTVMRTDGRSEFLEGIESMPWTDFSPTAPLDMKRGSSTPHRAPLFQQPSEATC